uniref:Transposase n=1 Tax=Caenorhabditis tropicalis TaxID=1561998 RepID=A0A1I7TLQ5_9PELO
MKGQIELHDAHREVKKRIDDMQPMPDGEETNPSFNRATNVWIDNMYEYEKSEDILRALQKQKDDLDREEKEMKSNNSDD